MSKERNVLLLSGPQHFDERRPVTGELRRWAEHLDPLGIAIVAAYLKEAGFEVFWQEMNPKRPVRPEDWEGVAAIFISSRFLDSDLAQRIIDCAFLNRVPVVVGGYGPTLSPKRFAGAVLVKGEFEPVAQEFLDDFGRGKLKEVYDARQLPPWNISQSYRWPDRSIFGKPQGPLASLRRITQEWQRGCYNNCSFCSPARLQRRGPDGKVRSRSLKDIIAEIEHLGLGSERRYLFSTDLNTSAMDPEMLKELFGYLQRRGIRWFTEGTIAPLVADLEKNGPEDCLLARMSPLREKGGCYSFLYGADDLDAAKVKGSLDKEVSALKGWVEVFRRFGIPLNLSVVIGLDHHTFPESFFVVRQVLEEVRPPYTFIHIATPYPGTPWGEKVKKEGRFLEGTRSLDFNHRRVVFQPQNMTPEELQQGYYWLLRTINSLPATGRVLGDNFGSRCWEASPFLGLLMAGLPWRLETRLTIEELQIRGYLNPIIQRELDRGYQDWLRKNG